MIELLQIIFLLLHIAFVVFIFFLTLAFASAGPFVPSSKRATEAMIELAGIKKEMNVIDLGSGDGRVLFHAARKGAHATGYEINPFLVFFTKLKALLINKQSTVTVFWKSLWNAKLSNADIVFVYLLPNKLTKLQAKIAKECQPGTVVISNSFIFKDWTIEKQDLQNHIYRFIVPKQA